MAQEPTDPRKSESFALASGLFRANELVTAFVRSKVRTWVPTESAKSEADAVMYGQYLRIDSWMRTLAKLNEPADFQAVAAACRAMLETCIDMALLFRDPADHARILAWEESTKLKHAQCLERFFASRNGEQPSEAQKHVIEFATREKARIDGLRAKYGWVDAKTGASKHPERWTGHGLLEDARAADSAGLSFKFESFYETQYREVCWSVHGSALTIRSVRAQDFAGVPGLLFPRCSDLAVTASEILLRYFRAWDADKERAFADLRRDRTLMTELVRRSTLGQPFP